MDRRPATPDPQVQLHSSLRSLAGFALAGEERTPVGLPMGARNVADVLLLELIFEAANTLFHLLQLLQAEEHRPTGQHRI